MIRPHTSADMPAIERMWREVGWVENDEQAAAIGSFLEEATSRVAEIDGEVEALATGHLGWLRHGDTDLRAVAISSVMTSWVGRKQGLARRVTAEVVAEGARAGAVVATLGIFDQGFYDTLGFGTGAYEPHVRFDPSTLRTSAPYRRPVRLGVADHAEIADAVRTRRRVHGGLILDGWRYMEAELAWTDKPIGLGYRDDDGRLSHFIWGRTKGESGPYSLQFVVYQTPRQLGELLALLRSLGDQVHTVSMPEPPDIQMQSIVRQPFRSQAVTKGGDHATGVTSDAWWQARILDVPAAVAAMGTSGRSVRFNLELSDPITDHGDGWPGVAGDYTITLGDESHATTGTDPALPTLRASVGAFTRWWLGAHSASGLTVVDDFEATGDLLAALDDAVALPAPRAGVYY